MYVPLSSDRLSHMQVRARRQNGRAERQVYGVHHKSFSNYETAIRVLRRGRLVGALALVGYWVVIALTINAAHTGHLQETLLGIAGALGTLLLGVPVCWLTSSFPQMMHEQGQSLWWWLKRVAPGCFVLVGLIVLW